MNTNVVLRDLFRKYLKRCDNDSGNQCQSVIGNDVNRSNNLLCIYFYEWSDLNRVPICFTDMYSFNKFLSDSGLYLSSYQRDLVSNLHVVFMSCYKNSKVICICSDYADLKCRLALF